MLTAWFAPGRVEERDSLEVASEASGAVSSAAGSCGLASFKVVGFKLAVRSELESTPLGAALM